MAQLKYNLNKSLLHSASMVAKQLNSAIGTVFDHSDVVVFHGGDILGWSKNKTPI